MDREDELRRLLHQLYRRYRAEAQPIVDELIAIARRKPPPPIILDVDTNATDAIRYLMGPRS
jgi:hypothetical protein